MPTFETPEQINAIVDIAIGRILIAAGDRTDTVVEVRPVDPANRLDLKAVEQTKVDYANGTLVVRQTRQHSPFNKVGWAEVTIELPTGSRVNGTTGIGEFRSDGELGECRFKTGVGDIVLDRTGRLTAQNSSGDVIVESVNGDADVRSGGDVRIRQIDGTAVIKSPNGDAELGSVTGDLRVNSANGDIKVEFAGGDVDAKTSNGDVRVHEVVRGSVSLEASVGEVEVGVWQGSSAWLDARSSAGRVRNSLEPTGEPGRNEETVKVRARTSTGDVVAYRA
jgi:DUF4097 and DUF4098 domain-containing protein YvlB